MNDGQPTVEIDGVIWREGDYGVAADGMVVMVVRRESSGELATEWPRGRPCLAWEFMGSECGGFRIGSRYDDVPRPVRKMRLVPADEVDS